MSASRLLVRVVLAVGMAALLVAAQPRAQPTTTEATDAGPRRADFKAEVVVDVEARRDFTQQMVDSIFSFNELGFQEFETQKYVTASSKSTASRWKPVWRVSRHPGSPAGALANRSSHLGPTSMAFHKRRRSRAWPIETH